MELIVGLVSIVSVAVYTPIGIKLLLLARKTKQVPELALGLSLVLGGTLGGSGFMAATIMARSGASAATLVAYAAFVLVCIANTCRSLFVLRLTSFSPLARRAVLLVMLGVYVWDMVQNGFLHGADNLADPSKNHFGDPWVATARFAMFALQAVLVIGLYLRQRKQLRIGLGDPVLANRAMLWAAQATAIAGVHFIMWLHVAGFIDMVAHHAGIGAFLAIDAGATLFGLMPPAWYVRWVARESEVAA